MLLNEKHTIYQSGIKLVYLVELYKMGQIIFTFPVIISTHFIFEGGLIQFPLQCFQQLSTSFHLLHTFRPVQCGTRLQLTIT